MPKNKKDTALGSSQHVDSLPKLLKPPNSIFLPRVKKGRFQESIFIHLYPSYPEYILHGLFADMLLNQIESTLPEVKSSI